MTVNVNSAFGFSQWSGTGTTPSYELSQRLIANGNGHAIFRGDAVIPLSTGYIDYATNGAGVQLAGIFMGCEYLNTSLNRVVWSNYWPGSGATGDITAWIVDDPNSQWLVQTDSGGPFLLASVGETVDVSTGGVGSTITGLSQMVVTYASLSTSSATLPFRVVGLYQSPPGAVGTDIANPYNYVIVRFAFATTKVATGV